MSRFFFSVFCLSLFSFTHIFNIVEIGICLGNRSQNINFIASVTTNSFIFIESQDDMIEETTYPGNINNDESK